MSTEIRNEHRPPHEVRPASRQDFLPLLRLREQWVERFASDHPPQERWCPATYPVWDVPDERTLLPHLAGSDGRGAAVATASGDVCALLLFWREKDNSQLAVANQNPLFLPHETSAAAGGMLVDFALAEARRQSLTSVRMGFHGFVDQIDPTRALYLARGFSGELLFEMVTASLRIDPGPTALEFRSAEAFGLEAYYQLEQACGYCRSADAARANCEFSKKMWAQADPARDWLVGCLDGRAVGIIRVAVTQQGLGVVDAIAVVPEHRGRKIGLAMLAHGLSVLAGRTHLAYLNVHHDNPAAIRLYQLAGFRTHHVHGELVKGVAHVG